MNYSLRMKRLLVGSAAGAMVLATVPTGIAAADAAAVCEDAPENDFDDVAESNSHKTNIDCLAAYGITSGDADGDYNPGGPVTRGQMATFIARFITQAESGSLDVPTDADDAFDDDDGTTHENAINYLASIDVVAGTGGDNYSPGATVTRGQMARFIVNALEHLGFDVPEDAEDAFDDDNGSTHEDMINILAELQVVSGFNDGTYRPGDGVSRQQMATYVIGAAGAADDQDLWNGEFVTEPTEADGVVTGLPSTGGRNANQYQYVANGEAVTVTVGNNDVLFVDGAQATTGAFYGALSVGDRVTVEANTPGANRQTHRLVNVDTATINSGLLGEVNTTDDDFDIIEPVTGAVLRNVEYDGAFVLFRVDGQSSTLAAFELDVNPGDTIEIEGTGADAANVRTISLTNQTVSGTVAAVPGANQFTIRTTAGAVVGPFTAANTDAITVDGDNASGANFGDFDAELSVGDRITYARRLGQQTIALTNRAAETVTGFVADVAGAGPLTFNIDDADGDELANGVSTAPAGAPLSTIYVVDGSIASQAEFEAALTNQDRVVYQAPDAGTNTSKRLELTNRSVPTIDAGQEYTDDTAVTVTGTAGAGASVTVLISDGNLATTDISRTVTANSNGDWTVTVDATALDNVDLQVSATTTDQFGTMQAIGVVTENL